MLRLYLLRHGKSSWADAGQPDEERPLTGRGRKAAARMGAEMTARGYRPALVLCSTARRARETLDHLAPALVSPPEISMEDRLYLASARTLIARLRGLPAGPDSVLVIGHNPGLHDCALSLAARTPASGRRRLEGPFPTAALAALEFDTERWAGIGPGRGRVIDVLRPRELM